MARDGDGRGVLLDLVRAAELAGQPYDPLGSTAPGVPELDRALGLAGTSLQVGDILLLRTGHGPAFAGLTAQERTARELTCPGLAHEEPVVRWLWDHHAAAVAADNLAVEAWPIDLSAEAFPFGALHTVLIGQLGQLGLGELWDLEALAADCAADGRYEVFLVSAPLLVPGGYGSPANALALK